MPARTAVSADARAARAFHFDCGCGRRGPGAHLLLVVWSLLEIAGGKCIMSQAESLHCVFLMNDDFTPMEFVVQVLERFFGMDWETATQTMLRIHDQSSAECGFYPRQEAEQKVADVLAFAERHRHPLQCAFEMAKDPNSRQ
jgi:ATP-dependent Clp protease adaptor protein ClpS